MQQSRSILEGNTLSGSRLVLEITEDTMISLSEPMLKNISTIKELEIHLSIDDFGTGYSNLSNLINLSVNEIKDLLKKLMKIKNTIL